jgi:lipoate-protein ligase A
VIYIVSNSKDAAFHFSTEEYLVQHYPYNEPIIMIWQADRCAMLGCNQIAESEIDIAYAEQEHIQIVRRSSGGGTIFTDLGTFLYTMIFPYQKEQNTLQNIKETAIYPIVNTLNQIGLNAIIEGRNDILIDTKKISGFAQYTKHGRICVHGSLLFDTDLEMLTNVLHVDTEKISSKALKSVRSRVTNIKDHMPHPCSVNEFLELFKSNLFHHTSCKIHNLTPHDLSEIDKIYHQKYGNIAWNMQKIPIYTIHKSKRFTIGKIEIYLDIHKSIVSTCAIKGDFLGFKPIDELESTLTNIPLQYITFKKAIDHIDLHEYLAGISKDELLSFIFERGNHV